MPGSRDQSPGDDYFNDLSRQPSKKGEEDGSKRHNSQDGENGQVLKPKRIACVLCRKRKLKCDGIKPACGTCTRLSHDCSYDEVRRKSGPKRGYVKALEARLAQVETLLKTQDEPPSSSRTDTNGALNVGMIPEFGGVGMAGSTANVIQNTTGQPNFTDFQNIGATGDTGTEDPFPWEMIGLGLDEPLPTQDVVNELDALYFSKIHPSLPMIHRARYYAAMNLAPHARPPVCLRYAMWTNAAAVSDKYDGLQEHFYQRARKYIQQDEMKGHGENMITVAHCQTWILLATHEFKLMYFPRAWMSSGRASRMAQMMGLHRLDGTGLDVKQCLPPPKDWTEREERRRTFWMSFCVDRYSSIGTGWPMSIEEGDVLTNLPADETAYEYNKPAKTMRLPEALEPSGPSKLSPLAGVIFMACLFGRNLTHLHRPTPDDQDDDLNGEFWRRHRSMDNILLNTALALPDALRLPAGLNDPNNVFLNMSIHTSTICLHQAAIFKADKNRMSARISAESKVRCITAAAEIASIMRQISHLDLAAMNPFISFCLYVAARVFVQYLKSRPKDAQVKASLQFLLSAMHAIKRKNPLTESFLVQLDVDLEGAGLEESHQLRSQMKFNPAVASRSPGCPQNHLGMKDMESCQTTYGDQGLAAYTRPSQKIVDDPANRQAHTFGVSPENNLAFSSSNNISKFELPNRQRTPGSLNVSGVYQSPNKGASGSIEMDTSPDGSGDQPTPESSTHSHHDPSSHTSNTGYSPQTQLNQHSQQQMQMDPNFTTMLDPNNPSIPADFDMGAFTAIDNQQSGYVLPQNWGGVSTGLTPGTTGMTPGSTNSAVNGVGMNDMMNLTDADWNQMMESLIANGWDSGLDHGVNIQEVMGRRL